MATRATSKKKAGKPGADDLQVLHPELPVKNVGGRDLVVREYGFIEGLRMRPIIEPMLKDMEALISLDGQPTNDQVLDLMGNHIEEFQELLAVASDTDVAFVAGLNQNDGTRLADAWWLVNGPFYWRTAISRVAVARVQAKAAKTAGATSTPPSSGTATESATSDATPAGS
ncbi:MAG: DUF6631 family protein [Pseudomonadaceae bacterium]|jgi:hypothetical protein